MKKLGMFVIFLMAASLLPLTLASGAALSTTSYDDHFQAMKGKPGGGTTPPASQLVDWGYDRIGAAAARASVSGTVQVAVLDSGVDYTHSDLAGVVTFCYSAEKGTVGCDRNSKDDDGHGTHVAGTIAALDNDQDSVGAAAGHVEIYNIKVLGRRGGDWSWLNDGIRVATNGPDGLPGTADDAEVISMSLGGDLTGATSIINALQDAVDYALSYGVILVAAAGNEGTCDAGDTQASWPALANGVIAVGASGIHDGVNFVNNMADYAGDAMPCFSNVLPNNEVDITAPGVYITATAKGGGVTEMSGTSMATPYTSAIVALMILAGHSNILGRLQSTAIDLGYDASLQGAGLINAAAAV
ncbi:MAG: S8 family serine peptidase [Candidatus Heimdallarchaeota archaeon]|nr:S8 family serine peptidase [Candidatus Heimdallarchaeota archaeon]